MHIVIQNIPEAQMKEEVLKLRELGYEANLAEDTEVNQVMQSHIDLILERRKDPEMSKTHSLDEVMAKYEHRRKA